MPIRTDLALDLHEAAEQNLSGVVKKEYQNNGVLFQKIIIQNRDGVKALQKPVGTYITAELSPLHLFVPKKEQVLAVADELKNLLPETGTALVVGLGNTAITPDALGPKVAQMIFATRHIGAQMAKETGLENARSVAAVAPGVVGRTGIETAETVKAVAQKVNPSVIIVVDALASRKVGRLGTTVQLSNTGISPGGGVGNARSEISEQTMGVPVISVGVPTVVDAATLCYDISCGQSRAINEKGAMIVTPREIDLIITRGAKFLANCINLALQPNLEKELLYQMAE